METKLLIDFSKNSRKEVKEISQEEFSNKDLGIGSRQEEFNQFFREILNKYKKNVRFYDDKLSKYEIFDENGEWLIHVDYNPEDQWFNYSYWRFMMPFILKFWLNGQTLRNFLEEAHELMIPVLEQDFELVGVTPGRDFYY